MSWLRKKLSGLVDYHPTTSQCRHT